MSYEIKYRVLPANFFEKKSRGDGKNIIKGKPSKRQQSVPLMHLKECPINSSINIEFPLSD
jgi:hypothetical protein